MFQCWLDVDKASQLTLHSMQKPNPHISLTMIHNSFHLNPNTKIHACILFYSLTMDQVDYNPGVPHVNSTNPPTSLPQLFKNIYSVFFQGFFRTSI